MDQPETIALPGAHQGDDLTVPAELVAGFHALGREQTVRRGHIVLAEDADSNDVLYIVSGTVQVMLYSAMGQETILRTMTAGQLFGEMSALDGAPRSASVVALSETRLVRMTAAGFNQLLMDRPGAAHFIACLLARRVRSLTEKLHELATLPMPRRLASELLRISQPTGADGALGIDMFPTHADLAARIGSQRESVSRELSGWKKRGLMQQTGRRVAIPSPLTLLAALDVPVRNAVL